MCDGNRLLLETTKVAWIDNIPTGSQDSTVDDAIYGNDSSLRAIVKLFLKRFSKAESTQIQVRQLVLKVMKLSEYSLSHTHTHTLPPPSLYLPSLPTSPYSSNLSLSLTQVPTPQRLSQLSTSSPALSSHQNLQPHQQPSTSKRDLLSSFTSRMHNATSIQSSSQKESSQSSQSSCELSQGDGLRWLDEDPVPSKTKRDEGTLAGEGTESDDEEALEKVEIDPLVFSREEFDAGEQ